MRPSDKKKKPVLIVLDVLIILLAITGLVLILKPVINNWRQDQVSRQLMDQFNNGDGTVSFDPDDLVVSGEDLEYFNDFDAYETAPTSETQPAGTTRATIATQTGEFTKPSAKHTPTPEPTPTPAVTVELSDGPYAIVEAPEDVSVPAGFYRSLQEMDGQMVPVYKSLHGELTLLYLYRQSIGDGFYYLDQQTNQYKPYLVLSVPAQSFTVLTPDESVTIPEGWTQTSLTIDGMILPVWRENDQEQSIYLVYLMDARGNQLFYRYDTTSQLLLPFDAAAQPADPTTTPEPAVTVTPAPTDPDGDSGKPNPWTLATAIMGLICLALVGLLIWQGARRGRDSADGDDEPLLPPPPIKRL